MDGYAVTADLAKMLGHPVRLRILDILAQREACICHLTTALHKRQAYVSQQLMRLREARLVTDRPRDRGALWNVVLIRGGGM